MPTPIVFDYDVILSERSESKNFRTQETLARKSVRWTFHDNDRGNLKRVLLFESGNHPTLQ